MQIIKHVKTSCYGQAMACFSSNSCRRSIFHYESILAPISGELTQIFTFCMSVFFVVDFILPAPVQLRAGEWNWQKVFVLYVSAKPGPVALSFAFAWARDGKLSMHMHEKVKREVVF